MFPRVFNDDNTKVTLELRDLVESGINIWDFQYESCYYHTEKIKGLEQKIVDHFYFRQIGQETPARWLHYFRTRIKEIMPYYKQLANSEEIMGRIKDPLESYNLTEEFTRDTTSSGTASSSGTANNNATESHNESGENGSTDIFSNTPQGEISNLDRHMSEARKVTNDASSVGTSSVGSDSEHSESSESSETGKETYTLTRRGNIGVQPLGDEIRKLRDSYINIDMMIIHDLEDLFLKVY